MIAEIVEEEVAEDTNDNDNLEEENQNDITKPRASIIRDAIDIPAYYTMNIKFKIVRNCGSYNARKCKAIGDY